MIVVIAPGPAPWLEPTVAALGVHDRVEVWAPWAMAPWWTALPDPIGGFAARRQRAGAGGAGWPLLQAAARAWAGAAVDRRLTVDRIERAAVDAWAARRLARLAAPPRLVVTATGAATHTLVVARARAIRSVLVVDRPWLRRLNRDLDRAADALPTRPCLRRLRAPRADVVRQEHERTLADLLAVRGHHAAEVCTLGGVAAARLVALPAPTAPAPRGTPPSAAAHGHATIVLAGGATARAGLDLALALLDATPQLHLRVRQVAGVDRPLALDHPRLAWWTGTDGITDGAQAVIAPAWCESYPAEVATAAARGLPIIATAAAAGFAAHQRVVPGDVAAVRAAVEAIVTGAARPAPSPPRLPGLAARACLPSAGPVATRA
ncbi:MAG: hypothetical protein R3B06_27400 [Kofleriaceae bacterium]